VILLNSSEKLVQKVNYKNNNGGLKIFNPPFNLKINGEEKMESKLEGVDQIKFYYKNCLIVGNVYTVCLLMSSDKKILSRGVAICSVLDAHNKKVARKKSLDRAKKALFEKNKNLEIKIDDKRSFKFISKSFKIKTKEQEEKISNLLTGLDLEFESKKLNGFSYLDVFIPYVYPMEVTSKDFKFKSEFLPEPTKEETKMFKLQ